MSSLGSTFKYKLLYKFQKKDANLGNLYLQKILKDFFRVSTGQHDLVYRITFMNKFNKIIEFFLYPPRKPLYTVDKIWVRLHGGEKSSLFAVYSNSKIFLVSRAKTLMDR